GLTSLPFEVHPFILLWPGKRRGPCQARCVAFGLLYHSRGRVLDSPLRDSGKRIRAASTSGNRTSEAGVAKVVPAFGVHVFGPALVKDAGVLLRAGDIGSPGAREHIQALLMAGALVVVVGTATRDGAAAGVGGIIPVLSVVLLRHAGGAGVADLVMTQHLLH